MEYLSFWKIDDKREISVNIGISVVMGVFIGFNMSFNNIENLW